MPGLATPRPFPVTVIGWLFVAAGGLGVAHHAGDLATPGPVPMAEAWVVVVRLLAIVGGAFLLAGANWARWLLVAWLAYHVALGAWHSTSEMVAHLVLLGVIGYLLVRPDASAYFRGGRRRPSTMSRGAS